VDFPKPTVLTVGKGRNNPLMVSTIFIPDSGLFEETVETVQTWSYNKPTVETVGWF